MAWIAKLSAGQIKKYVNKETTELRNQVCDDLKAIKDTQDRHERWFDEFFSNYLKGIKDVKYRESVRKAKELRSRDDE